MSLAVSIVVMHVNNTQGQLVDTSQTLEKTREGPVGVDDQNIKKGDP